MEPMTPYECICLTKLLSVALGMMGQHQIAAAELDVALEALKRMADQKVDWTWQQKDLYKSLVDCAKEIARR